MSHSSTRSNIEAEAVCAELIHDYLELASATEWSWPTTPDELRKFAGQLCHVAASVRAMTRNGYGLKGGTTENARYLVKHFAKAMLMQSSHSGHDRYASSVKQRCRKLNCL